MKDKILAAIKAKFPNVNLSKLRLDAIAAKIETKVNADETLIDAQIDAYNDFNPLEELAKNDDKIRNLEAKQKAAPKKEENQETPKPEDPPNDTPEWAKSIIEANKLLFDKVNNLEGEKRHTTIKQAVAEKLKEVPLSYWGNWQTPDKEEGIESFIEKVNTGYADFKKDLTDKGLMSVPQPGGGHGAAGNGKPATQKEIEDVTANLKI